MTAQHGNRRRRALVAEVVAALTVAAGALLVHAGQPEPSGRDEHSEGPAAETTTVDSTAGPGAEGAATSAESVRGEDGAIAAAVVYTAAPQRWLYLTDEEIATAVEAIATPGAAGLLVEETLEEIGIAREELPQASGRVWWLVHPSRGGLRATAPTTPRWRCGR